MRFDAIIFDFDGVIIDSEMASNRHLADYLSQIHGPITAEEAIARFMGLSGARFEGAVADWLGRPAPEDFHDSMRAAHDRFSEEGLDPVAGAVDFIRDLPSDLPIAVASSSSTDWIARHLENVGLRPRFGDYLFSGAEHVEHGKPAPDIYLHAATELGVPIERTAILEDSPVGMAAAVSSGAFAIGLLAGGHCRPEVEQVLLRAGAQAIAHNYDQVAPLLA